MNQEKKKILFLSDPQSVHTRKWVMALANKGYHINLVGLTEVNHSDYESMPHVKVHSLMVPAKIVNGLTSDFCKINYLKVLPRLRKIIREVDPDIVHAHYATSYGVLAALSGRPFLLSLWGDDVLVFPKRSFFHRLLLQFNLLRADHIFSTSGALTTAAHFYTSKEIRIVPFGIDINKLKPVVRDASLFGVNEIVIGTIKALEDTYGIDYLIRAFKIVCDRMPELPLKLLIVGGGSQEQVLKNLVQELGLNQKTTFSGKVSHAEVTKYHNMLDVYVALSRSESFGVAALEAQACSKPVVVSDCGGLPEIIEQNVTGFVVPTGGIVEAADALQKLILSESLRKKMGEAGRKRVINLYSWDRCVDLMTGLYREIGLHG